jgi:acyl transferase domain-containing protein
MAQPTLSAIALNTPYISIQKDLVMDQINASERHDLAIAIVGIAGRFPEARTIAEFWQNLQRGRDSISFFSEEELAAAGIEPTLVSNPRYVPARGIVQDIELFDANFFGYNPREAEVIDPQHRIFLQCAWEALETAGYNPDLFPGRIGVYASTSMSSYLQNLYLSQTTHLAEHSVAVGLGNDKDFLPTRVSYKLNLKGPSLNIQTGCSSSLVATHVACQDLLSYQCDMALAGGVSILVPQMAGYLYEDDGIYAQDGRCRAFSAAASGTVPGNGAGVVVLKRLADAIADGDYIYAVIKGTAVNNDGGIKIGFTAPSIDGQSDVIAEALATAGVSPDTISYVETHGTGTKLGDPIEIAALTQAFRINTDAVQYCAIGSVKTNIGHLDAAAGIAGLIKTVLSLQHRQLPPSLYCDQPHPDIDFKNSPFYVNTSLKEWESGATPRRAGVSAFGIGGTNAHIVLEEAPLQEPSQRSKPWHLLVLSSKTETALEHATKRLVDWLEQQRNSAIADVAYTLQVGRKPFSHRRMLVCQSVEDGIRLLKNLCSLALGSNIRVWRSSSMQRSRLSASMSITARNFCYPWSVLTCVKCCIKMHKKLIAERLRRSSIPEAPSICARCWRMIAPTKAARRLTSHGSRIWRHS